jgi:uncharacterized protein (TIGR02266 family)
MPDERRNTRRALLSGVHATYESATGERHQVLVSDLSKEGLFLQTESLLAIGKRLSLEISVTGEPAPWAALGRVVWTRSTRDPWGSPGMGVKFIDVEDSVLAAIERLVASRTSAGPGGAAAAPPRERTMLGVGLAPRPSVPGPPVVREKTVLGIGLAPPAPSAPAPSAELGEDDAGPAREASLTIDLVARREPSDAIDLVAKKSPVPVLVTEEPYAQPSRGLVNVNAATPEEEEELPRLPKRRTGWVLLAFVLVAMAAVVAYAFRDRLRQRWLHVAASSRAELFACEATSARGPGLSWTAGRDGRHSAALPASLER